MIYFRKDADCSIEDIEAPIHEAAQWHSDAFGEVAIENDENIPCSVCLESVSVSGVQLENHGSIR